MLAAAFAVLLASAALLTAATDSDGYDAPAEDEFFVYTDETMTVIDSAKDLSSTRLAIPPQVTVISDGAFAGCRGLTEVDFSGAAALTNIGNGAFAGCPLTGLDLSGCASLEAIGNPELSGQKGSFQGTSVEYVSLPAGLVLIGDSAFRDCTSLHTVAIPESSGLRAIEDRAFRNTGLVGMDLSEASALTWIGDDSFSDCASMEWIVMPDPGVVDHIGSYAFYGSGLTEADLSATHVTELKFDVFRDCTRLQKVVLNRELASLYGGYYGGEYGVFMGCTSLKVVSIPDGSSLASIGDHVFDGCPVVGLDLSGTPVTYLGDLGIGKGAGPGYSPGTLTLPSGLRTLGPDVVYVCPDTIRFAGGVPPASLTSVSPGFVNGASPSFGGTALGSDDAANAALLASSPAGTWYLERGSGCSYSQDAPPAPPAVYEDMVLTGDTVLSGTAEVNNLDTAGYDLTVSGNLNVHGDITGLRDGSFILVESGAAVTVSGRVSGTGGYIDNGGDVSVSADTVFEGVRLVGDLDAGSHTLTLRNVAVLGTVTGGSSVVIDRTVSVGWNSFALGAAPCVLSGPVTFLPGSHVSVYNGGSFDDTTDPSSNLRTSFSVNGFAFATVYTTDPGVPVTVTDMLVRNTLHLDGSVPIVWTYGGEDVSGHACIGEYPELGAVILTGPEEVPEQPLPPFIIDPDWDRPDTPVVIVPLPTPVVPQVPSGTDDGDDDGAVAAVAAVAAAVAVLAAAVLLRRD